MSDLRSLVCDPSGIVIGEMVYRCMKCTRTFDLNTELFQHYQRSHMTGTESATASGSSFSSSAIDKTKSQSQLDAFAAQVMAGGNGGSRNIIRNNGLSGGTVTVNPDFNPRLPRSLAITTSAAGSGAGLFSPGQSPKRLKMSVQPSQLQMRLNSSNNQQQQQQQLSASQPTITFSVPSDLRELQNSSARNNNNNNNNNNKSAIVSLASSLPASTTLKSLLTSGRKALFNGSPSGGSVNSSGGLSRSSDNFASTMLATMSHATATRSLNSNGSNLNNNNNNINNGPAGGVGSNITAASLLTRKINTKPFDQAELSGQVIRNTDPDNPSQSARGGYVTCEVCNMMKYYSSHLSRRFGVYSCEACAKFFRRYLIRPKDYQCDRDGNCDLTVSTPGGRCKACLLKACLAKYVVDLKRYPKIVEQNKAEFVNSSVEHTTSHLVASMAAAAAAGRQPRTAPTATPNSGTSTPSIKVEREDDDDDPELDEDEEDSQQAGYMDQDDDEDEGEGQDSDPAEQQIDANNYRQVTPLKILLKPESLPQVQVSSPSISKSTSGVSPKYQTSPSNSNNASSSAGSIPPSNNNNAPKLGIFMKRSEFQGLNAINSADDDEDDDDDDDEDEDGDGDDSQGGEEMEPEAGLESNSEDNNLNDDGDQVPSEVMQEEEGDNDQSDDIHGGDEEEGTSHHDGEQVELDPDEPELFDSDADPEQHINDEEEEEEGDDAPENEDEEFSGNNNLVKLKLDPDVMTSAMTRTLPGTSPLKLNGHAENRMGTRRSSSASNGGGGGGSPSDPENNNNNHGQFMLTPPRSGGDSAGGNLLNRLPAIKRQIACKRCEGCLAMDCGTCLFCLDKPKFGGPGQKKQKCIKRRCMGISGLAVGV